MKRHTPGTGSKRTPTRPWLPKTPEDLAARLPRGALWVFGYASLMWSPEFRYRTRSIGVVHGYHRALCMFSHRHRGTPRRPGLVMALCRGGSCWGVAFQVPASRARDVLRLLWEREMRNYVYQPRVVSVRLQGKTPVRALTFVADETHPQFAGDLGFERTARLVAQGVGERGRNVDYLSMTIAHMHEIGVRDRRLDLVLERVLELHERRARRQNRTR